MTRITAFKVIGVPPAQVSRYVSDANNLPSYLPVSHVEILETNETRTKARHDFTAAGRKMELVCVVETTEQGRRVRFQAVEGLKLEGTWFLEETKDGTKVTYAVEYEPPGGLLGKVLDRLRMRKEMTRITTEGLEKLKELLEG